MTYDALDPGLVAGFWAELLGRDVVAEPGAADGPAALRLPGAPTQVDLRVVPDGAAEVADAASTAWNTGKAVIEQMLEDPNSTLRNTLTDAVIRLGTRIRDDRPLQEKMNGWVARVAQHVATNYSREIISVITETVRGWDADDTSRKIELQVGRDLQFIRINGTVVGSLAGLAIYTVSVLIFG